MTHSSVIDHTLPRDGLAEDQLENLARASIALSRLSPALADIASAMAAGAQQQARQSAWISEQANQMAEALQGTMNHLRSSSDSVQGIVGTIKRIADQTKIISINASIEAARAGTLGAAFGVVAKEVESLSSQTTSATERISEQVEGIQGDIRDAVQAVGLDRSAETVLGKEEFCIQRLTSEMTEIAQVAAKSAGSAEEVHRTSEEIRGLSEDLLLTIGRFRLPAHHRSVEIFREVLQQGILAGMERFQIESYLRRTAVDLPIFELFYVTDREGCQVTANVWTDGRDGHNRVGSTWSDRPWFTEVRDSMDVRVSDIYRSTATDNFCFTLSGPIFDHEGTWVGVLAADINFAELIAL